MIASFISSIGCSTVSQMQAAYEAGDETQLNKLMNIAVRPDYPYATRKQAVVALGEIAHLSSVPGLISLLSEWDRRTTLKEEVICALGKIGDPAAVVPIGRLLDRSLDDPNGELRITAIPVIGDLGGTDAAEILVNALVYYDIRMTRKQMGTPRGVFSGEEQTWSAREDSVRAGNLPPPPRGLLREGVQGGTGGLFGNTPDLPMEAPDTAPKERALVHESLIKVGDMAIAAIETYIKSHNTTSTLRNELLKILGEIVDQREGSGAESESSSDS
ncbi:MAG: HEAT repeat domain-containing protein [Candidatus Latescibacterota bacterium]|nr:HEAT repeat domain-containing protein [Candidatus Latescibacterota bacterium]